MRSRNECQCRFRLCRNESLEALSQLEEEKLSHILGTPPSQISQHSFRHANKPQAKQLQFSIVSTQAAEEIAKRVELPADMAFSSANLRQLGLYLISWNYPRIYSRVLTNHRKEGADIDFELQRLLGLTPKQVGARLAQKWRLHPSIIKPLGSAADDVTLRTREKNESEFTMTDVCEVSELYAKTKDPETYPEAEEVWSSNEDSIIQVIGEETFERIEQKVEESVELYVDVSDVIKKLPILGECMKPQRKSSRHTVAKTHISSGAQKSCRISLNRYIALSNKLASLWTPCVFSWMKSSLLLVL